MFSRTHVSDKRRMLDVRGFVTGKPPQIVFIVCLGSFAVILMSFAYHVSVTKLVNPDISEVCLYLLIENLGLSSYHVTLTVQ